MELVAGWLELEGPPAHQPQPLAVPAEHHADPPVQLPALLYAPHPFCCRMFVGHMGSTELYTNAHPVSLCMMGPPLLGLLLLLCGFFYWEWVLPIQPFF